MNGVAPDDWYDDNRVLLDYALEQQALRTETGAGITGEVVRFRDPDAAVILAMGSAGGMIGESAVKAAPEVRPAVPQPVAVPVERWGASGAGWTAALCVAAALIVVQGFATWRLRSGRRSNGPRRILAVANQPPVTVLGPVLESATASD
jgi:hypothetical protein